MIDSLVRWFEENQREAKRSGQEIVDVAEEQSGAESKYDVILDQASFETWLAKLEKAPLFAFVTETNGTDAQHSQLVGLSFAVATPPRICTLTSSPKASSVPESLRR